MRHLPGGEDGKRRCAAPADRPGGRRPSAQRGQRARQRAHQRIPPGTRLERGVGEQVEQYGRHRQHAGQRIDEGAQQSHARRHQPGPEIQRRRRSHPPGGQGAMHGASHGAVAFPFDPVIQGACARARQRHADKQPEESPQVDRRRRSQKESPGGRECDEQRDFRFRQFEIRTQNLRPVAACLRRMRRAGLCAGRERRAREVFGRMWRHGRSASGQ